MPEEPSRLESQLDALVTEALSLRFTTDAVVPTEYGALDPKAFVESLLAVRARLDRLESLLTTALRVKGRAAREARRLRTLADDSWDQASSASRSSSRRSDYLGAKEHYADNNLATFDQQRAARQAEKLSHYADECADVIRTIHRGLDNFRSDHLAIIRMMSFESHLERTSVDKGY
jgi:hypothetical protein